MVKVKYELDDIGKQRESLKQIVRTYYDHSKNTGRWL